MGTWLKKNIRYFLRQVGHTLLSLGDLGQETEMQKRVRPWIDDKGDKTLRVAYDLEEGSMVFDLGGYEGQWASDIFSRYCPTIHIFEPVGEFADDIEARFKKNNKVFVHKFGLANQNGNAKLAIDRDGSSAFKNGGDQVEIALVKAADFLSEKKVAAIDLMKINIEGGEYDLLDHLIETGCISNIKNIQVQFHDFIPCAQERMEAIQKKLAETHFLTYQYPFIWENWCRKADDD